MGSGDSGHPESSDRGRHTATNDHDPPRTAALGTGAPVLQDSCARSEQLLIGLFLLVPMLALMGAVPVAWGWGLSWADVGLAVGFYVPSALGITVGYHRYFTHRAFKANRTLRRALAIVGSLALQGDVISWAAEHRRHHAFADKHGDPHSPWRYGTTPRALAKGFGYAHVGWLLGRDRANRARFTPDLMADPDVARISRRFPAWVVISLLAPAVLDAAISMSPRGLLTGLFWAGLVRIAVLNHVTWSINSICHLVGQRPFACRDRATNVWPLAVLSMGESWHNLHHADPTCARHGVQRGQIDISARVIWIFEQLGWAHHVRWPTPRRIAHLATSDTQA